MEDQEEKSRFFEETFLLVDISIYITLGILFLTLSNVKITFINCHISWKTYSVAEILLLIRQVELIRKKEFAITAFNPENEAFVVYLTLIS